MLGWYAIQYIWYVVLWTVPLGIMVAKNYVPGNLSNSKLVELDTTYLGS